MDGSRVTKDRAKALRRTMSLPEVLLWKAIKGGAIDGLQFRKQHPMSSGTPGWRRRESRRCGCRRG